MERADNEYAEKLGVKKAELQKYRNLVKSLEKIINPETGENIVQELRNLIERIIAKRLKPAQVPRYPVEEGEDLVDPALLVSDVKAGNLEPKVWETTEVKREKRRSFRRSGNYAGLRQVKFYGRRQIARTTESGGVDDGSAQRICREMRRRKS